MQNPWIKRCVFISVGYPSLILCKEAELLFLGYRALELKVCIIHLNSPCHQFQGNSEHCLIGLSKADELKQMASS